MTVSIINIAQKWDMRAILPEPIHFSIMTAFTHNCTLILT